MRIDIRPANGTQLSNLKAVPNNVKTIDLSWTLPINDTGYRAAQIWVNTINDVESASLVTTVGGNFYSYLAPDTASRYFWIRTVNEWNRTDGPFTGPAQAQAKLMTTGDIGVFDLATANIINKLSVANITGLGALATISKVDASTQVNNLGNLAFANRVYADEIGVGTLAAGVIYAGTISADKVTAGTLTGQTIQTSTGSTRVVINEAAGNNIKVYYNGTMSAQIGGGGSAAAIGINYANSGNAGISVSNSSNFGAIISGARGASISGGSGGLDVSSSSGNAITIASGSNGIVQNGGGTNWLRTLVPANDNAWSLGYTGQRWTEVYAASSTIVTSDERTKTDIKDTTVGLSFIESLRPVTYRQRISKRIVNDLKQDEVDIKDEVPFVGPKPLPYTVTEITGARPHHGLIAQEVKQAMTSHGIEDAAFWGMDNPADENSQQFLRYEELIAPLIKAVQELSAVVKAQGERIAALEGVARL